MKKIIFVCLVTSFLSGCYHQSAIPLGNDLMEIDVSASPVYGRAGAMDMALKKAASATVMSGYDKFIVKDNSGWNESTLSGGSYGQATVNGNSGQASSGSYIGTSRHPEVKMVIRMYHYDDKGADKAVDARDLLKQNNN